MGVDLLRVPSQWYHPPFFPYDCRMSFRKALLEFENDRGNQPPEENHQNFIHQISITLVVEQTKEGQSSYFREI